VLGVSACCTLFDDMPPQVRCALFGCCRMATSRFTAISARGTVLAVHENPAGWPPGLLPTSSVRKILLEYWSVLRGSSSTGGATVLYDLDVRRGRREVHRSSIGVRFPG
jgi:hypothetical protein